MGLAAPALAGLAIPAAGEATAAAAGGAGASGLGDILASLGLTGTTVDPTLLGTAGGAISPGAASLGGEAGLATPSSALGFAGDVSTAVPNAAGAVGGVSPPGVGYFPDFSTASLPTESFLSGNIPGADPLASGSLSGLTTGDLPQIPGSSLALGGYSGPSTPIGGDVAAPAIGGATEPIPTTIGGTSPDIGTAGGAAKAALDQSVGGAASDTGGFLKSLGLSPGILTGLGLTGATAIGGQLLGPTIAKKFGLDTPPNSANLTATAQQAENLANQQTQYGAALEQYMTTGQLPPGAQAAVDQATQAAIATVKSKFAGMGLGGSAQEAAAIASIQQNASAQSFQIALQMAQQGQQAISTAEQALGLTSTVYSNLMQATIQQDQNLSNAISNFASAVGGGLAVGTGQQLAKQAVTA